MLKTSNVEVIRVCFAGCRLVAIVVTKCYYSNERLRAATSKYNVLHRSKDGSQLLVEIKV